MITALDRTTGEIHEVLCDALDVEFLSQFTIRVEHSGQYRYLVTALPTRYARKHDLKQGSTYMLARLLLGLEYSKVDHINRNTLDNRRSNLRAATDSEQARNRYSVNPTSGYKGVTWRTDKNRWQARVKIHGRQVYSSMHTDVVAAARGYDEAVQRIHGEFALTNHQLGLL